MEKEMKKNGKGKFPFQTFGKLFAMVIFLLAMSFCEKEAEAPVMPPPWYPETNTSGDPVLAVFESRIPCPGCERLKFALAIYGIRQTNAPTTYMMARVYVGKDDNRLTNAGNVTITYGTTLDSLHTVYQLTSGAPAEFQSFWKINEDLLFVLDENRAPRVGDAGHGYVLNRTR